MMTEFSFFFFEWSFCLTWMHQYSRMDWIWNDLVNKGWMDVHIAVRGREEIIDWMMDGQMERGLIRIRFVWKDGHINNGYMNGWLNDEWMEEWINDYTVSRMNKRVDICWTVWTSITLANTHLSSCIEKCYCPLLAKSEYDLRLLKRAEEA